MSAERALDALVDGVFALDRDGRITAWNAAMERLAGVPRADALGRALFERFPGWQGERPHLARALAGEAVVVPAFPAAPAGRTYEARYQPALPDVVVSVRDVTEVHAIRDALHESDARFQIMADTSPVLLWIAGSDGLCNFFNQRWLEFTGRTMAEELGNGWAEGVHPEDFAMCIDTYLEAFVARRAFRMEYRLRRADGAYRWLLDTGVPRYQPSGGFAGYIGSCIDITDARLARDELEARVRERTAELEAFAYSVSHDLRAPLRGIDGFAHALLDDYGEVLDATAQRYVQRVRDSAARMGMLIDDLLQLSRVSRTELQISRCDAAELARTIVRTLHERDPERRASVVIPDHIPVTADPRLLEIVLDNLLGNAWKFTAKRPDPAIELLAQREGHEMVMTVRDNGAGFDMSYAAKLFLPFHRLHRDEDFPGTGIGLATVARIVRRHGGRVWATGELGTGAAFHIALPRRD